MKIRTIDISGMGGGYENSCQLMLKAALDFLEHTSVNPKEFEYSVGKTANAKAMQEKMLEAVNRDCTGAMMGATLGHVFYIFHHGRDAWLRVACEGEADRSFEWDGTPASIPLSVTGTVAKAMVTPRTGKMP